ncbi:hypothetical protein [Amycolatopsis suaedae]|uniref:Tetratricopeptide repeat protein n=1 Tax=Amycolatopsis suaedae TaxID=2510978 RepID=A0A4Q7J7M5_9PSEU|nr:hypothetical protein [Amycolatopsis suaedae]RZQ63189.1 hypothetical protein EWH70_16050 [Amycolatopsis suaedae]
MTQTEDELWGRLERAQQLPFGAARTALVEEVVRHADAHNLAELRYAARLYSIEAYTYGGEPAKAFVPFAWCLAAHDRGEADPRYDYHLLWDFKGMVGKMISFPEVSLEQIRGVLDQMEQRYRKAGHTMNPVHQYRELVARHVGDREEAAEQYRLWCAAPRGEMSDCVGCEPGEKVSHLDWLGRHEDAVAVALPVLGGEFTCREQPHGILTDLLLPYLHTGRHTEAAEAHRRAYRAIQHDRAKLGAVASHLRFCGLSGNSARGLELVGRHLGWLDEAPTPNADMWFCATAAFVLRLVAEAGHADVTVFRPAHGDRPAGEPTVAALHAELSERALALAARFDARNGTSRQGDTIRATLEAEPLLDHLPLSGPAREAARLATEQAPRPEPVNLPDRPEDLADVAERHAALFDDEAAAAAWQRFDELCPEPDPRLAARREIGRGTQLAEADPEAAEQAWRRAAGLYAELGDEARVAATRSRIGLLMCRTERVDEGLAELDAAIAELTRLAGGTAMLLRARLRRAWALSDAGRGDEAIAEVLEVDGLVDDVADAETLAASISFAAAQLLGDTEDERRRLALPHAARAAEAYERLGAGRVRYATYQLLGSLHAGFGELEAAYPRFVAATGVAEPGPRAAAEHMAGRVAMELERPEQAHQHLVAAVAGFTALGERVITAHIQVDLAGAALMLGLAEEAADAAEEALDLVMDPETADTARFRLVGAYRMLEQFEPALKLLDELAQRCADNGNSAGLAQMHGLAASILDRLDRDAAAAQRHLAAAGALREDDDRLAELDHTRQAALSWHWAGEREQARAALAEADRLAAEHAAGDEPPHRWLRAMLDYDAARVLSAVDDVAELGPATERAAAAADGFRVLEDVERVAAAEVLRGRLLADQGRPAEAEPIVAAALASLPDDSPQRPRVEEYLATLR